MHLLCTGESRHLFLGWLCSLTSEPSWMCRRAWICLRWSHHELLDSSCPGLARNPIMHIRFCYRLVVLDRLDLPATSVNRNSIVFYQLFEEKIKLAGIWDAQLLSAYYWPLNVMCTLNSLIPPEWACYQHVMVCPKTSAWLCIVSRKYKIGQQSFDLWWAYQFCRSKWQLRYPLFHKHPNVLRDCYLSSFSMHDRQNEMC